MSETDSLLADWQAKTDAWEPLLVSDQRKLLAAVQAVRALHVPGTVKVPAFDNFTTERVVCLACAGAEEGEYVPPHEAWTWPCPTVRSLEDALGGEQ